MEVGTVIDGKFKIEKELGRGSFGGVYRAKQMNIDRTVALKLLQPRGKADNEMRQRFKREAKLSFELRSPHSIRIHDFGETQSGQMFIVMEYLEGLPLDKLLRQEGAMSPERVTRIVRQILDSLIEAHQLGIVHRDLKPDNIFVCNNATQTDFVKVFDFGIAKVVGGGGAGTLKETAKLTMIGGTVGTPAYMSPEQCCGETLTQASDLYSLAIVIYELLTGKLPFEDANPVRTMMKQINESPPPLPAHLANTALGKATMRTLAKGPTDRFPSGVEFLEALEEPDDVPDDLFATPSLEQMSLSDGPDSIGDVVIADVDSVPSKVPRDDGGSDAKLLIAVIIAAFVLLLLAIAFVVVLVFQMY